MLNKVFWVQNIRKIVYLVSTSVALAIFFFVTDGTNFDSQRLLMLGQAYAFTALGYLYLALLASPLYSLFPRLSFKSLHLTARKAIGVSAFFFALFHASLLFFGLLGGFQGLFYLSSSYLLRISLGFIALSILSIMALTSLNFFIKRMGRWWKRLHRLVYLAGVLIVTHAILLGSHFGNLQSPLPQSLFVALAFLLTLEAVRFDKFLATRFIWFTPYRGLTLGITLAALIGVAIFLFSPVGANTSFGVHSAHQQLAREAQQGSFSNTTIPGLDGDKNKRYTVSFTPPQQVQPGQDVELKFKVFEAGTGNPVTVFKTPYEKPFHLIITDSQLKYFSHIHPDLQEGEFSISTSFPEPTLYHLYTDFQPVGAIEQQFAFTLPVGAGEVVGSTQKPDTRFTKTFGDNVVTLSTEGGLKAAKMALGEQKITFTIRDKGTGKPVKDLKPYLNTFGHLVMIRQGTYDYLHIHPYNLSKPKPDATFGPTVEFLPMGIYGPIKGGKYRLFGQFNRDGSIFLADYTVEVK